ncbi:hypothetical protein N7520_004816 [Penicillium odoratum]|uniref:uncharacterized protein n=1 Tax=Penicillium odoratum TaxID=1167516 RepID=UPI002548A33F|nr:uncharacterized protein N7520_004816 [Penicillium odoratum]KAJ5765257.1 hypothetical protein N7520_004816 [Penicillium odoratum]
MKLIGSIALLSAVALAHPSGLWWGTDFCYPSPENTDNHCSEAQEDGFDWSELADGDNWSFEGFSFDGFAPKDGCRVSGGKCIEGKLSRDDDWDLQIDAEQAPFSVKQFHITTSRDADLYLTYTLADGSPCHQVVSASPDGSDIVNEQCGDAVSVNFQLAVLDQFGDVDLELHQMGFDCSPGPKPAGPLVVTSSQPPPTTKIVVPTPPVESPKAPTTTTVEVIPTKPQAVTPSVVYTTDVVTVTRCPPSVTDCPDHDTISTTMVTTSAAASSSSPPCPDLVPKCLNTWLSVPKCSSNSDAACFCPSSEFTAKFKSCVEAWSSSQEQTDSALSYFAGICAPYIPGNPDIISLVPTTTPSVSSQHGTGAPSSTPSVVVVTPVPEPCTTVTWSSHTVTVPQVGFSTKTDASTTVVNLVTGSPLPPVISSFTTTKTITKSCTSTSTTPEAKKSTSSTGAPTTSPPTPTSTFVVSNAGSKVFSGNLWAIAVFILVLPFQ